MILLHHLLATSATHWDFRLLPKKLIRKQNHLYLRNRQLITSKVTLIIVSFAEKKNLLNLHFTSTKRNTIKKNINRSLSFLFYASSAEEKGKSQLHTEKHIPYFLF